MDSEKVLCRELKTEDEQFSVILFDDKLLGKGAYGECYLGFFPAKA